MTHKGQVNVIVGSSNDMMGLANEIGNDKGDTTINDGPSVLAVTSDGSWTLKVTADQNLSGTRRSGDTVVHGDVSARWDRRQLRRIAARSECRRAPSQHRVREAAMTMPSALFLNEIRDRLNARGERMTRPRQAVLGVLAEDRRHLSAEEIVAVVAERDTSVHRASVYRTLEALTNLGVVQHVHVSHGPTVYHLVDGDHGHLHLQCTSCGDISDVPSTLLGGVAAELDKGYDFTLDLGHVALSGLCSTCRDPSS